MKRRHQESKRDKGRSRYSRTTKGYNHDQNPHENWRSSLSCLPELFSQQNSVHISKRYRPNAKRREKSKTGEIHSHITTDKKWGCDAYFVSGADYIRMDDHLMILTSSSDVTFRSHERCGSPSRMLASENQVRAPSRNTGLILPIEKLTVSIDDGIGKLVFIDRGKSTCTCRLFGVWKQDRQVCHLLLFGAYLSSRLARPSRPHASRGFCSQRQQVYTVGYIVNHARHIWASSFCASPSSLVLNGLPG